MATKVVFYYDIVSPFARLAYVVLKRYEKPWNLEIDLRPVFLGGVMMAAGNKPPMTIPNKGKWMNGTDLPMHAKFIGTTMSFPDVFPFNSMNIVRFLRAVKDKEAPQVLDELTQLFWDQTWGGKGSAKYASDMKNFEKIVPKKTLSQDKLRDYLIISQSEDNKKRVKDEAVATAEEEGAFGFPWIKVTRQDGETSCFFGSDRFEIIADWLGKEYKGPFPDRKESRL